VFNGDSDRTAESFEDGYAGRLDEHVILVSHPLLQLAEDW
jgi:hypothetical protein